ncbi:MAG TPA: hypothetical protein DEO89_08915 [Lachnospiraceae bacterium]|nr:hypothetical protein [Lachnospiraceae bacterium]
MKYRLAAGILCACLIPANVCVGAAGKGMLDGDTKIIGTKKGNMKIRPKKGGIKKTPKLLKHKKGMIKKGKKVEGISGKVCLKSGKGVDGIKKEVYERWEKSMN